MAMYRPHIRKKHRISLVELKSTKRLPWSLQVVLPPTRESDFVIGRMEAFDRVYKSVNMTNDTLREIVMINFGEPFSKSLGPSVAQVYMERAKRILLSQPEVAMLPDSDRLAICRANAPKATGLFNARINAYVQLRACLRYVTKPCDIRHMTVWVLPLLPVEFVARRQFLPVLAT